MGVIRANPVRVTDWASRSAGSVWRAFDLQLVTYAGLLVAVGLVMAYTNSLENGRLSLQAGTTFSRGLMWAGIAIVMFLVATAFDYKWLKTFAWPLYGFQIGLLLLTLAIGDGVSGAARWVRIGEFTFQFSELAKVLMIIVLANYLGSRQGRLNSLPAVLGSVHPRRAAAGARHDAAGPRDVPRVRGDPRGHALDVRREPEVAPDARARSASR